MTDETIQTRQVYESGDYTVYDAAEVAGTQLVKGFAFLTAAAEQVGEFAAVTLTDEGGDLQFEKTTSRTGQYSTDGAAVRHIYIDHSLLEQLGGEDTEDGFDAPESLGIEIAPSDEDAWEESQETPEAAEDEAESLLADTGSDDAVEVEEDDEEEPDPEAEAEALLDEAAE